jgi:dienelactone hydrolase
MPEEFDINGTTVAGRLALPEKGHGPGVLVLHAWWGLTPFVEGVCERLAEEGFVAFAPDRYGSPTAATIEEAEVLQREREDWVRTEADLIASVEFLQTHEAVVGEGLGALGFSAGVAWALLLSVREPDLIRAVVAFYGTAPSDYSGAHAAYLGTMPNSTSGSQQMKCEGPRRRCVPQGARWGSTPTLASDTGSSRKTVPTTTTLRRLAWLGSEL